MLQLKDPGYTQGLPYEAAFILTLVLVIWGGNSSITFFLPRYLLLFFELGKFGN